MGRVQQQQQQQVAVLPPDPPRRQPSNPVEHAIASALNWRTTELTLAGAEVGLWMSLAFSLEVAGLQVRRWARDALRGSCVRGRGAARRSGLVASDLEAAGPDR